MGANIKGVPSLNEVCLVGRTINMPAAGAGTALSVKNAAGNEILNFACAADNSGIESFKDSGGSSYGYIINGYCFLPSLMLGVYNEESSAILVLTSVTRGFLPPYMTGAQRAAISTPKEGLIVYDTTAHKLYVKGSAAWEAITSV